MAITREEIEQVIKSELKHAEGHMSEVERRYKNGLITVEELDANYNKFLATRTVLRRVTWELFAKEATR